MHLHIFQRTDDGTFDLFEKLKNGNYLFLSNHDTFDEAEEERDSYFKEVPKEELKYYFDF